MGNNLIQNTTWWDVENNGFKPQEKDSIFIFGNTSSSKNSKRIISVKSKKTGKSFSVPISSKTVTNYKKIAAPQFKEFRGTFLKLIEGKSPPYRIQLRFVRDSRRTFDYLNVSQIVFDLMQEYGWIVNDDYKNVLPVFHPDVTVDKNNAGVEISVL